MSVIKASELDLSKLTFSDVKVDNNGRKMVYVNLNGGKVLVQTPKMNVPNGIKRWRKKDAVDNKDDSFEMELSFGVEDKNSDELNTFHQRMNDFDNLVKRNIIEHSKEWLGKPKVSMDVVEEAFYSPCVKIATDKDGNVLSYPSRLRTKLDRERKGDEFTGRFLSNKRYNTEVLSFDENKNKLNLTEYNYESIVPKGSQVMCVLELVYLSISTKVTAKWKVVQFRVWRNLQTITEYIMDDGDEEEVVVKEELSDDLDSLHEDEVSKEVEEEVSKQVEELQVDDKVKVIKKTRKSTVPVPTPVE